MGAENVARELIREAVGEAFSVYLGSADLRPVVAFFEGGGSLKLRDDASARGLVAAAAARARPARPALTCWASSADDPRRVVAAAGEFVLEGLYAQKKIGRSDDRGFVAPERRTETDDRPRAPGAPAAA